MWISSKISSACFRGNSSENLAKSLSGSLSGSSSRSSYGNFSRISLELASFNTVSGVPNGKINRTEMKTKRMAFLSNARRVVAKIDFDDI